MTDETPMSGISILRAVLEEPDLRRARAEAFTHAVFSEIDDLVLGRDRDELFRRLRDLFHSNGASIMTDEARRKEGLEPRDAKGWTPSERVARERLKIDAMQVMASGILAKGWPPILDGGMKDGGEA